MPGPEVHGHQPTATVFLLSFPGRLGNRGSDVDKQNPKTKTCQGNAGNSSKIIILFLLGNPRERLMPGPEVHGHQSASYGFPTLFPASPAQKKRKDNEQRAATAKGRCHCRGNWFKQ